MTMRLLSPRQAAQSAQPQTVQTIAPDRPRKRLRFSIRTPAAAAAVAALLLGATLPLAQHADAQVDAAVGWMEHAPTPGDASTTVVLDGTELLPGAPVIAVDEITVAYDPTAQGQIEPFDPHAEE